MKTEQFTREQLNNMDKEQLVEQILDSQEKLIESQAKIDILTGELNHTKAMLFGRSPCCTAEKRSSDRRVEPHKGDAVRTQE